MMKLCPVKYGVGVAPITSLALLHFNGTDGAATYLDEYGNTWTASGSFTPVLDTGKYKFATSSLECLWGVSSGRISTAIPSVQEDTDFTLSFWYWHDAAGGGLSIYGREICEIEIGTRIYRLTKVISGASPLTLLDLTNSTDDTAGNMLDDQWVWYQLIRQGTTCSLYIGTSGTATLEAQVIGPAPAVSSTTANVRMGGNFPGLEGWIDELRFANTADTDHTVPVAPYSPP